MASREALRVSGEQEYPVPALDDRSAVLLFVDRARSVRPDFKATDGDEADIRAIVARLDALPLATELAAARVRMFSPRMLRERLEVSLDELSSGSRDLPERQRTLKGAIDWSYRLLDDTEQAIFARASVFRGGADIESLEAVIDPGGDLPGTVSDHIAALAEKSLLSLEVPNGGEPRMRMLELIRDYAGERLAEEPSMAALADLMRPAARNESRRLSSLTVRSRLGSIDPVGIA